MSDKTLGQVAYEAWAVSCWGSVAEAGEWTTRTAKGEDAWQAAAEAVVKERGHRADAAVHRWLEEIQKQIDWINKGKSTASPTERAVIEAAKAALLDLKAHVARHFELFGTSNPHYKFPLRDLLETIEALEEVE